MASVLATDQKVEKSKSPAFHAAAAVLAAYALIGIVLLASARRDYLELHAILDAGASLLSGILAALLWNMGRRAAGPFPIWLSIGFAVTSLLELIHVSVTVEWAVGAAATWPPAAHVLPIAIGGSLWLLRRHKDRALGFALIAVAAACAFLLIFQWLPTYAPPTFLGITQPALILAPLMWLAVGIACWRWRTTDRILQPLALMSAALVVAHAAMLYSQGPHDAPAMVAHLGKVAGYLVLLLSLMQMASFDMLERIRAERRLEELNDALELRVRERTSDLESSNSTLESEILVRRQAEQTAQSQLERLDLLRQITHAIGERRNLDSIFQVVVRSLEDHLRVDLCCLCLHDGTSTALTVSKIGVKSAGLARELAISERARVPIDENGLSQCVRGKLVYESDLERSMSPFPQRLLQTGLRSLVLSPLRFESRIFGVLIAARQQAEAFSSGECEFLRQLSEHVALAAHQTQLYEALQQAYNDLQQTQQAVMQQERLRALGQMASGIGHDINNALSPIALYAESLLESEPDLPPRVRDFLATIRRAVDHVTQTVSRMREFYRQREPEAAQLPIQVNQVVQQAIELTRARWSDMPQERGIVIAVETDLARDPPPISGIESEIREALISLVFNAVDAMPKGGTLTVRTKTFDRPHDSAGGYIQVDVVDIGIGMSDETRRRCMEPFFTTKGERGTGLGLATVSGVMRRHGGEIEIRSAPGRGTTVSLIFPATAAAVTTAAPTRTLAAPMRLRLLLVDDDLLLLKVLHGILETDGHIVTEASGGQAAIDAFQAAHQRKEPFSAVITDLGMPYVDGRRVASAVKETSPSTPVILLTGWAQHLTSDEEMPAHIDRVLIKPPKLRELRQMLAEVCKPEFP